MKKTILVFLLLFTGSLLWAQQKYALVIGNGAYANISRLSNPVNDANDMAAALQGLGFTVDTVLNGSLEQMENAVTRLRNRLSVSRDSYGFFFYAGHGVQSSGENYLVPVDANIQNETTLRLRAVSVSAMLEDLNAAGNALNVVVLDACRDNPFGWSRSGSRGLSLVANQPADSIIVYATAAGSVASDGAGRNGLFTQHLLPHLRTPGLEVTEVFRLTMGDVARVSNNQQRPAIYNQFPGTAYLGTRPAAVFDQGAINIAVGSLEISTVTAGSLEIRGGNLNQRLDLPAWGTLPIARIEAGTYRVIMRYEDGGLEERTVTIGRQETHRLDFNYRPVVVAAAPQIIRPPPPVAETGTLEVSSFFSGTVEIIGQGVNRSERVAQGGSFTLADLNAGTYQVNMTYPNGLRDEKTVEISPSGSARVEFDFNSFIANSQNIVAAVPFRTHPSPTFLPAPPPPVFTNPFINPSIRWTANSEGVSTARYNIDNEFIDGSERDVLNMEVRLTGGGNNRWANIGTDHPTLIRNLREGSGIRFKALGDGQRWIIVIHTPNGSGGNFHYRAIISTRRNRVVDITIPYTRFAQTVPGEQRVRFDKAKISIFAFHRDLSISSSPSTSTLKVFEFEILP